MSPNPETGAQSVAFETAAIITTVDSHTYNGNVHPDHSYGTGAHGGYLNALILKTTSLHFSTTLAHTCQPVTIALHVEYLRPATFGEVALKVRDSKLGRTSSTVHVSVSQGDKDKAVAYVT